MIVKKLLFTAVLIVLMSVSFTSLTHSQTKIEGDESDYVTLYRSFYFQSPQQGSFYEDEETLGVSIAGFPDIVENEYYRVILQFDISELTAPVTQAVFNVYKEQTFGDDFNIDLYGSSQNRDDFIHVSESTTEDEGEFFSTNGYSKLGGTDPFIEYTDPDYDWYSVDITSFINNRIAEYQSGGGTNSIVVLKLRPDGTYSGSSLDTRYNFATGNSNREPYLAIYQDNAQQTVSGNEGWRMLSSPMKNSRYDDITDAFWTQGYTGADYESGSSNVYYWNEGDGDQDTTSRGFTSVSYNNQTLRTGQGFIAYMYEDDDFDATGINGGFPKTLDVDGVANSGTVNLPVQLSSQGGVYDSAQDGWNLVGNPYDTAIDWDGAGWTKTNIDQTIYIWSESSSDYLTWNGASGTLTDGKIAAFQGFWVKANNTSPELNVTESAQTTGATLYKEQQPVPEMKLTLKGNDMKSQTVLMFSDQGQWGKDNLDAFKLQPLADDYLSLYTTLADNTPMDLQALPANFTEKFETDIGITGSNIEGEYTLTWNKKNIPGDWSFLLKDHETGEEINLSGQSSYHFEMKSADLAKESQNVAKPSNKLIQSSPVLRTKVNTKPYRFSFRIIPGSSVSTESEDMPNKMILEQNYPNPFNPTTEISYQLPVSQDVSLKVFDMLGREVATLVNGRIAAGKHEVSFDASALSSGIYIYRLTAGSEVITRQMTLIK